MDITEAIFIRAKKDPKFCDGVIEKLEEKARKLTEQLVVAEKAIRAMKKLKRK
jgi:hypothetical protein